MSGSTTVIFFVDGAGVLFGRILPNNFSVQTDIRSPGFLEIDLVAHCGGTLSGTFLYTLTATDIHTGWTERRAVMGKGQAGVLVAIKEIRAALPFPLRAIDSDNGEEFINYHLLDFCLSARPRIAFTRSRPYKKDDNAHIEQKNWTHVRKLVGWDRFDTEKATDAINDLYRKEWRLMMNLFQPSVKLVRKVRVGSRLTRKYDKPQTPLDRLIATGQGESEKLKRLQRLRSTLDPFELARAIDRKLEKITRLVSPVRGPGGDRSKKVLQPPDPHLALTRDRAA